MMAVPIPVWLGRPGLAGGIDKDGSRAAELLGSGFGSVEFGSVTADPLPGQNGGIAALVAALRPLVSAQWRAAIGIGLSLPPDIDATGITTQWASGFVEAARVADYVSLNLSARANQRFLGQQHRFALADAFARVVAVRDRMRQVGRDVRLAVKLPVGEGKPLPVDAALAAGIDQVTAVLPDVGERMAWLAEVVRAVRGRAAVVAVGGIRSAADVTAARACGADGVQVHRLFVEQGTLCLRTLLETA